jgi:hypothetical protein
MEILGQFSPEIDNHRLLTDTGNIHLDRQITKVITIMELSNDKKEFVEKFWQLHRKQLPDSRPNSLKLPVPRGPKPLPLFPDLFDQVDA